MPLWCEHYSTRDRSQKTRRSTRKGTPELASTKILHLVVAERTETILCASPAPNIHTLFPGSTMRLAGYLKPTPDPTPLIPEVPKRQTCTKMPCTTLVPDAPTYPDRTPPGIPGLGTHTLHYKLLRYIITVKHT